MEDVLYLQRLHAELEKECAAFDEEHGRAP